jgi:hypothetical protein
VQGAFRHVLYGLDCTPYLRLLLFLFLLLLLLLLLPDCCQVDEVKGIMLQNVEQVLVRGERLDVLVDRTDDLRDQVSPTAGCTATGQ